MKKDNLLKFILGSAIVAAMALTVNSCSKDEDPCEDVTCLNGGTCNDGNCNCATGYEGSRCETKASAKFEGTYKYNESGCGATIVDYSVTMTGSSTAANKILITGFAAFECGGSPIVVEATVSGNNITVTANQIFCSAQIIISSGTGTLSSGAITMSYSGTLNGASFTCSGVYTKL